MNNPFAPSQGQAPIEGTDSRTASSDHDSGAKARSFHREPWFTQLPPELRKAILANTKHRPPRGYEERLRRYFENVD